MGRALVGSLLDFLNDTKNSVETLETTTTVRKYGADMGLSTTWAVSGITHTISSRDLFVITRDSTGKDIVPDSITIHPTLFDVTVRWGQAQAGRIIIL